MGGARRQLLVAAPAGAPTAIIVVMHGSTSTPEHQVRLSRMARLAEQGAVVAFPQGSIPSRAGWEWDLHGDVASSVRDAGSRMAAMMRNADFAEGVAALMQKRPPDFPDPPA